MSLDCVKCGQLFEDEGLPRKNTDEVARKKWRIVALKNHPDRGGDIEKFKNLSSCKDKLWDTNECDYLYHMGPNMFKKKSNFGTSSSGSHEGSRKGYSSTSSGTSRRGSRKGYSSTSSGTSRRGSRKTSRRGSRKTSRRGSRKSSRRGSRKKTVAQMRAECKEEGKVYDTTTKRCRASRKGSRRK